MNKYNLILEGSQNHKLLRRIMKSSIIDGNSKKLANPIARAAKYQELKDMFSSNPNRARVILRNGAKRFNRERINSIFPRRTPNPGAGPIPPALLSRLAIASR